MAEVIIETTLIKEYGRESTYDRIIGERITVELVALGFGSNWKSVWDYHWPEARRPAPARRRQSETAVQQQT